MALQLPTDTAAVRLTTRQYELFGRRIGNGVERRTLILAAAVAVPWLLLMLLVGVPFLSPVGPQVYIVPPFFVVWRALRRDESGRVSLLRFYDRVLSRKPSRRMVLRNPLLPAAGARQPERIRVVTRIRPGVTR